MRLLHAGGCGWVLRVGTCCGMLFEAFSLFLSCACSSLGPPGGPQGVSAGRFTGETPREGSPEVHQRFWVDFGVILFWVDTGSILDRFRVDFGTILG